MTHFDLTHFNSGTQKEADFLAGFIARQDSFRFFIGQLRNTNTGQAARHQLIVAPRGYGKTSLLRRIKIALRDQIEFKDRYIGLAFREEQHNVISLDIFWRNCLLSLLEAREEENAPDFELNLLDDLWNRSAPRSHLPREEQDGSLTWKLFEDYCSRLNRRPVLLIDNVDILLAGIPESHQWTLRTILQRPNGPVLIAAASKFPDSINDPAAAFHDFFRLSTLKALSDREVLACLSELAKRRGEKGLSVRAMLDNDPGRITSLNTMAGGNPRTLGVLYSVLETHMSDDVLAQLTAMLDTFTGWYQARTEELSLQSRAVFDALALNWDPMPASAIGAVTGLDTPTVSSHLNRLEKLGYAEVVPLTKSKRSRNAYQVSERFFNIWYLMRNGSRHTRQKIRFLTIFLRSCFSSSELHLMATSKLNQASNAESILAFAASIDDQNLRIKLLNIAADELPQFQKIDEICAFVDEISSSLKPQGRSNEVKVADNDFGRLGRAIIEQMKNGELDEAERNCKLLLASESGTRLGLVWFLYGLLLSIFSSRYLEAEVAFRNASQEAPQLPLIYVNFGNTLRKLKKYEEAEVAYRKAIELDNNDAEAWHELGALLADDEARNDEALAAYRRALDIDSKRFFTWIRLGRLLDVYLEQYDEAEAAYRSAIAIDNNNALAWAFLGDVLGRDEDKKTTAEESYRKALSIDEKNVHALSELAALIGKDPIRHNEAESLFNRLSVDFALYGNGWFNRASFLISKGRFDEAEAALLRCVEIQKDVAAIWGRLGMLYHNELKQFDKARQAYSKAIAIDNDFYLGWIFLGALYHDHLGLYSEALNAYEIGARLSPNPDGILFSNLALLNAFNLGDLKKAKYYADLADPLLSSGGKDLLSASLIWSRHSASEPIEGWDLLHRAITSSDKDVWKHHADDIERILGFSLKNNQGAWVKSQMEQSNYPVEFAPLYHAYVAILEGSDYLQKINPEVRGMSEKIYERLEYAVKGTV